jgi:hypothetical protein
MVVRGVRDDHIINTKKTLVNIWWFEKRGDFVRKKRGDFVRKELARTPITFTEECAPLPPMSRPASAAAKGASSKQEGEEGGKKKKKAAAAAPQKKNSASGNTTAMGVAERLVQHALAKQSRDNVSVVLLVFNHAAI